jgi:hypothetical protein
MPPPSTQTYWFDWAAAAKLSDLDLFGLFDP